MDKLERVLDDLECCYDAHICEQTSTKERWQEMEKLMDKQGFSQQELIDGWAKREEDRKNREDTKPSGDGA